MITPGRTFLVCNILLSWAWLSGNAESHDLRAQPLDENGEPGLQISYKSGDREFIEIAGLKTDKLVHFQNSQRKGDLIALRTNLPSVENISSMFGRHEVVNGIVSFYPQFLLQAGIPYYLEIDAELLSTSTNSLVYTFGLHKEDQEAVTEVAAVYPSASVLPSNLLKFYIHFSNPMSLGDVYSHIQLLDTNGKPLELPFLELGEELWDMESRRLTLLFDPGRIKRGLKPNLDEGAVLEEGKSYTLLVHDTMLDSKGRPLRKSFSKNFSVSSHDTVSPNLYNWKLSPPQVETRQPVTVIFPEPLDEALLQRVVSIVNEDGQEILGELSIESHETIWSLTPDEPWKSGTHRLKAQTILEDRAGNSIGRPFEVDLSRPSEHYPETKFVYLPFEVD